MNDYQERLQALNPHQSFIVQAPAGSGKTELLTQRFLKLLSVVKSPEEILAVTFTRKAAAQMRERLLQALKKASDQIVPPTSEHEKRTWSLAWDVLKRDEKHHWHLRENPNRLRIVTIDALCSYIVHKAPILSNFGGTPEMLDFPEPYYKAAVERLLRETTFNESWSTALSELLLHLDNRISVISQLLVTMLKNRDQWLPYLVGIKTQQMDLKHYLDGCFKRMITNHLEAIHKKLTPEISQPLISLLSYAANALRLEIDNPLAEFLTLSSLPKPTIDELDFWKNLALFLTTQKDEWRKSFNQKLGFLSPSQTKEPAEKEIRKKHKEEIGSLMEILSQDAELLKLLTEAKGLPPKELSNDQHAILTALAELLPVLVGFLNIIFQETGKVDFIEVMLRALNALGDELSPSEIALRLDYQLSHLLIDEYQDTSVSQYRLFEKMVMGWEPQDGRTVFLVGDPMQSIYRFRGAKVSLFMQTAHHGLGPIKLQPLHLTVNFRSNANIISWINQTFCKIFPQNDDLSLEGVSYATAQAFLKPVDIEPIQFHAILRGQRWQAEQISEIVLNTLKDPIESIAILVRAKRHLTDIIQQFKMLNIAFVAHEVEHLSLRHHIIDLLSLLKATSDWTDRVAWYAILRAPWLGLTLKDIFILSQKATSQILWDAILQFEELELSSEGKDRLRRFVPILTYWLNARQRHALHHWLRGLWIALGGPNCYQTPHFLNDIDKLFELIQSYQKGGKILNIDELELKLSQLYGDILLESENSSHQNQTVVIELMTIHKAKGLEFDVVIMPHLESRTLNTEQSLLLWFERSHSQGIDLILAPQRAQHEKVDLLYQYVAAQIRKKSDYETQRLLYVGATRAKRQLHFITEIDIVQGEIKTPSTGSFIEMLWPHVQNKLDFSIDRKSSVESMSEPPVLAYTRLPLDWQLPSPIQSFLHQNLNEAEPTDANMPIVPDFIARTAGTVFHQMLQRWINEGGLNEDALPFQAEKGCILALKQYGLQGDTLSRATECVMQALSNMLTDPKGRWILDPTHTEKQTEWHLSIATTKGIENNVIDYAFTDSRGIRWIVDYKLTQANKLDELQLMQEVMQYRDQLQRYQTIVTLLEKRSVRCGLYFPNAKRWWEMVP